ncbi:MAG: oxidoreductase, partial [Verrucomicrobia bacterium]|nr:oxidoreductase [Verrucomicrobiota bacterium]
MPEKSSDSNEKHSVTRRAFLGTTLVTGATLLARGSDVIFAESIASSNAAANPTWKLGGDLTVNRLGFGA